MIVYYKMKKSIVVLLLILFAQSSSKLLASDTLEVYNTQSKIHNAAYKYLLNAKEYMILNCNLISQDLDENKQIISVNDCQLIDCLEESIVSFNQVIIGLKKINAIQQEDLDLVIAKYEQAICDIISMRQEKEIDLYSTECESKDYYRTYMQELGYILDTVNSAKAKFYLLQRQEMKLAKN